MQLNNFGVATLLFGPAIFFAVTVFPWARNYSSFGAARALWIATLILGWLFPIIGGFYVGWKNRKNGAKESLIYLPFTIGSSLLFAVGQFLFDYERFGAAEFAMVAFFELARLAFIGTIVSVVAAAAGCMLRKTWAHLCHA